MWTFFYHWRLHQDFVMVLYDNVKVRTGVIKFVSGCVSVKLQAVNPFLALVTSYNIHGERFFICQRKATRCPVRIGTVHGCSGKTESSRKWTFLDGLTFHETLLGRVNTSSRHSVAGKRLSVCQSWWLAGEESLLPLTRTKHQLHACGVGCALNSENVTIHLVIFYW